MAEHRLTARGRASARLRRGALLMTMATAISPWAFTRPVAAVRATLVADADARVEEASPTRNFGTSSTLGADGSPRKEAYLRFSVPGGIGTVTSATLRLRVKDPTDNGPGVRAASPDWNESTITWANRPGAIGGVVANAGKLSSSIWVTYDVTSLVRAPGPVAFLLQPESNDGADFASRNASTNRPELVVESTTGGGGGDTTETAFPAVADTYGDEARPDRNFGSDTTLYSQGGSDPDSATYLRFGVSGLSGPVLRSTLRLWVTNDTGNGPAVHPTSGDWSESGLTWQNRPAPTGGAVADPGAVAKGWAEFDVSPIVTGAGSFDFVLLSASSDSLGISSSEAASAERPQLVVRTGPAPTTTTTTSTTTTTLPPTTTTTVPPTTTTTVPPTTTTTLPPTTTTTAPPADQPVAEAGEPWLGLARLVTDACEPGCVRTTYSLSVSDVAPDDAGDQRNAFRYAPGSTAILRLEWSRSAGGAGCGTPAPTTMEVSLRTPGGGRIGSSDWDAQIPGTCSGALERTIRFDVDPMDANADGDYYGVMEVYGRLTDGADTRGARPADPGDAPGRYARGHLVSGGVMVGWHEDGDDPVVMAANELTLGEPVGLVRTYESDWEPPSMRVRNWMAEGKYVLWSVKPPEDAAGHDDWTPVATGAEDDMLRQQVSQLQTWAVAFDTQAGFIFNHEPHDDTDIPDRLDPCERSGNSAFPCSGTAAEFIDIYERLRSIIDTLGADRVQLVYTATLSWAVDVAPGSAVLGSGDPMTQGAGGESVIDYVDLIAHDSYNWYCFRVRCDWEYPDEFGAWGRGVELAETQGKQLIMAETASHPGCLDTAPSSVFHCENEDPADLGPTRDDWVVRIGTWLESDARARRWLLGFAYFHSFHTNDWRFVGQTGMTGSGLAGWQEVFVTDSSRNDALGGHDYFTQYGFNDL